MRIPLEMQFEITIQRPTPEDVVKAKVLGKLVDKKIKESKYLVRLERILTECAQDCIRELPII